MNTTEFLMIASSICPDRDLIVFEGQRFTFERTYERVNRLANALAGLGVIKGDRVGMLQVNCNQYIEAYFAAATLGAIFVPMNFRAKADELEYLISNSEAKVLFAGQRYMDMVKNVLPAQTGVQSYVCMDARIEGGLYYEDLVDQAPADEIFTEIDDDEITILMYTAGTTGRPKGVPLRYSGFVSYILENVEPADPEVEERNILTVPLYHVAGIQAMMAAVYGGRTLVLMKQFEVKEWMETVQREKVTRAMLVPTMLKWVLDAPDFQAYDLSSLNVITYGAAPMPFEVISRAIKALPGAMFINAFGQTETASTITTLGPEDHVLEGTEEEIQTRLKRLSSSIGRPLSDVEVRIVDDEGRPLPAGQVGEILARGPRIMSGYWRDEEKTSQVMTEDGWLRTSDRGWMDEDGYIYMSGRLDEVIIRGGENISPKEVEDALDANPKVREVAVIGVPDPEWGQEVRAVVALEPGQTASAEEIIEYCRERLSGFKRPRSVVFVDDLPRNAMGKLIKRQLREEYGQP